LTSVFLTDIYTTTLTISTSLALYLYVDIRKIKWMNEWMINLKQGNQCPSQDSKQAPSWYKSWVLILEWTCSELGLNTYTMKWRKKKKSHLVVYGCETWSLRGKIIDWGEIFWLEREEVIGGKMKLYYVGLHNVYALLNIIWLIKSRSTRLGGSYSKHSNDQKCKTDFRQKIWWEEQRSSHRSDFNMERKFKGVRCEGLHVILLAQNTDLRLLPQKAKILWPYEWRTLPYQVSYIPCTQLRHKYRRVLSQTHEVCSAGPKYQSVPLFYLIFVGNLLPKHRFCIH